MSVNARPEGLNVLLTVEDTGIGIAEADLPRLGNPFFQARSAYDRRHDGTGLGLSIVKGLVALHGGELQVSSELGRGTRITIQLPLDCERRPPATVSTIAQPDFTHTRDPQTAESQNFEVRKRA